MPPAVLLRVLAGVSRARRSRTRAAIAVDQVRVPVRIALGVAPQPTDGLVRLGVGRGGAVLLELDGGEAAHQKRVRGEAGAVLGAPLRVEGLPLLLLLVAAQARGDGFQVQLALDRVPDEAQAVAHRASVPVNLGDRGADDFLVHPRVRRDLADRLLPIPHPAQ